MPLIQLLASEDAACREAAALALCFLGWSSTDAKDEAFSKLCSTALEASGASTAPFPFNPLLQSDAPAECQAAAYALHMVSQVGVQQCSPRQILLSVFLFSLARGRKASDQTEVSLHCATGDSNSRRLLPAYAECHLMQSVSPSG